ncbi:MAG: hypothetical protein LC779_07160 [Actinobacteria bacterium]|nr:hypothetical protein [Actinomycetota bacterium]
MAVQGRVGRLTALALATGTIVAASTGVAGASAADTRQMTATGTGSALKITINLPEAAAAVLGTSHIEQTISLAAGINATLLPLTSKVANPATVTNGVVSKSTSAVAHVGVTLPLAAAKTLTAPVTAVLDTALNATDSTTSTATGAVTSTLNTAIGTLNDATANQTAPLTAPVQAAVDGAVATLTSTLNSLTSTLTGLNGGATNLLSLDSITSDQTISRNGAALTSDVSNTVKNISVLNGLVKVAAVTSQATATAGGAPGTAKAATNAPVFKVDVADGALTALLDQNGLNVTSGVTGPLPTDLQNTVNGALNTVNGLLNQVAGIDVAIGEGKTSAAPDGTSAAAAVASTVLTVDPPALHGVVNGVALPVALLPANQKFLTLELVSANAAVANQVVPAIAPPAVAPKSLPRTGGSLPLGVAATVALGAALVIRRRRTAEI